LRLTFCDRYPEKPPKVRFTTKMFHPNVYADGNICLDVIAAKWSPSYTVSSILTSIQSLLTDPNVQSPANPVCLLCYIVVHPLSICSLFFARKLRSCSSRTKNPMRGGYDELQKNRSHQLDFFSLVLIFLCSSALHDNVDFIGPSTHDIRAKGLNSSAEIPVKHWQHCQTTAVGAFSVLPCHQSRYFSRAASIDWASTMCILASPLVWGALGNSLETANSILSSGIINGGGEKTGTGSLRQTWEIMRKCATSTAAARNE
jgi:hypothetical protein